MALYVDGFVIVVAKSKVKAYQKMSQAASKMWKKYGALEYRECVGEDMKPKFGVPFPKLAGAKAGETVIFSWIVYKSKAARDACNKKVMKDPAMADCMPEGGMPFDMKRFSFGGFDMIVDE